MNIGMLWMDNSADELLEKVDRAARYYQSKYGKVPNLCYVHPTMKTSDAAEQVNGVEIRTSRSVLPHHFWIGVDSNKIPYFGEGIAD